MPHSLSHDKHEVMCLQKQNEATPAAGIEADGEEVL